MATRLRPDVLGTFRELGSLGRMRSELVGHPGRTSFWVVVYQAGAMQHRFLLPLIGPFVRDLIEDLPRHGLGLLMHAELQEPFWEVHMSVPLDMCTGLRQGHQEMADDERVITDHALMVARVLNPTFMEAPASCGAPELVSVTSVLPPEMMERTPRMKDAMHAH
jgi:hypothetical protein